MAAKVIVRYGMRYWTGIAAAMLFMSCPIAYAHKPLDIHRGNLNYESAQLIPDHTVSWAIYKELDNSPDYYKFEARAGERFFSQMTIPKLEGLRDFTPSLALIGPDLASAKIESHKESRVLASVPFSVPESMDAVAIDYAGQIPSPEFYEPFTQTTYWERQQVVVEKLPATGTYYLVVYDHSPAGVIEGKKKYALAVGEREEFSALDIFTTLPAAWFKTKFFFGDYVVPTIAIAAMLAALAGAVYIVKRKKDAGQKSSSSKMSL
jgi:hypothetical protein